MTRILDIYNLNPVKGRLGIEIEVETDKPPPVIDEIISNNWRVESDGSLRGYSAEYVIINPIEATQVRGHLDYLLKLFETKKVTVFNSFRAGVHVHLNVQDLTPYQVGTLASVYYILEKALIKFCGSSREGNFFCLRKEDAEWAYMLLLDSLSNRNFHHFDNDNIRYSSINFRAMPRYGSIEFRSMATEPGFKKIEPWCAIINKMYEYARSAPEREEICFDFSVKGPSMWASDILGKDLFNLIEYDEIEKDLTRSLRATQSLIYLRDEKNA
jgi:Putative amidoligase enzyme